MGIALEKGRQGVYGWWMEVKRISGGSERYFLRLELGAGSEGRGAVSISSYDKMAHTE